MQRFNALPRVDTRFRQLEQSERGRVEEPNRRATLPEIVSNFDRRFLNQLVNIGKSLNGGEIDLEKVKSSVDALKYLHEMAKNDYLESLLKPEYHRESKIPSTIPVPSSSFQLHNSIMVTPNAAGNASIVFNPFALFTTAARTTLFVNNHATLTGSASNANFLPVNIGQTIPGVYTQYRLVSASMVVKYTGRLDIVQGVIGGSIMFDNSIGYGDSSGTIVNAALSKFGDFNLTMDAFYTQENMTLNGLRALYFPLDNTFEQYIPIDTVRNGFSINAYIMGGVPSQAYYKVDIYCNFECLADATFLNYIPTSCPSASYNPEMKQEAIAAVQQRPITFEDEIKRDVIGGSTDGWSIFDKAISTFGKFLPSLESIAGMLFK